MNRVLNVTRIQLVNARAILGWPPVILALVFLSTLAVFAALGDTVPAEHRNTGGIISIYIVMLVTHLQTMTQTFPFALGLSVTRRTFFAATALLVTGQSLGYGVLLYVLRVVEQATGGWGLHVKFFAVPFLVQDNALLQILVYTVPFLLLSFAGVYLGVVFKRWGQLGVYILGISAGVLVTAAAVLVTWQQWWPSVGRFFAEHSTLTLLAGYPLPLAVLLAGFGYLTIRRATP